MSDVFTQGGDPVDYLSSVGLSNKTPTPEPPKNTPPEDYTKKRFELAQEASKIDEQEISHLTSLQSKYMDLASQPTPVPRDPNIRDIPKAPKNLDYTDPIKAFQNPGVIIATLGSLFSRAPMTAALNAGGAAMEAYHKGEAEVFKQKRDEWKDALQAAQAQNQVELERYNVAWKKSDAAVKDKMAEMMAIAAGVKDEVMIAGIKTGQLDRVDKILEAREKANDKLQEVQTRLNNFDAASVESTARLIGENRIPPLTGWTMRSPFGQSVMTRVQEMYPDYKAENYYASKSAATASAAAEPRAISQSLTAITKQQAAVDAYENVAKKNGVVLVQLAKKVDNTGVPVIERWLRAGQQATGDPDVARFNTQIHLYRAEVARILTNPNLSGVLTDTARKEAEGFLQGGASAGQVEAVVNLINQDFDRRHQAITEEVKSLKDQLHGAITPPPTTTQPVHVSSPAEAMKLAPGTPYVTPDGAEYTR